MVKQTTGKRVNEKTGRGEGCKSGRKKPSFEEKTRFQLSEAGGISIALPIRSLDRSAHPTNILEYCRGNHMISESEGVESLRGRHWQFTDIGLTPNQTHQLAGVSGGVPRN